MSKAHPNINHASIDSSQEISHALSDAAISGHMDIVKDLAPKADLYSVLSATIGNPCDGWVRQEIQHFLKGHIEERVAALEPIDTFSRLLVAARDGDMKALHDNMPLTSYSMLRVAEVVATPDARDDIKLFASREDDPFEAHAAHQAVVDAARRGDYQSVHDGMRGPLVKDDDWWDVLDEAVRISSLEIAKDVLARFEATDLHSWSRRSHSNGLRLAAEAGHMEMLQLLNENNVGMRMEAIFSAAQHGHAEVVDYLVMSEASFREETSPISEMLGWRTFLGNEQEIIEMKSQAIACAADHGQSELVAHLKPKVSLDQALEFAAENGMRQGVKALLTHMEGGYERAMSKAVQNGHIDIAQDIRQHIANRDHQVLQSHVLEMEHVEQIAERPRRRM